MIALLQISWKCDSERILKICQYLTKLCVDYVGLLFWPTLDIVELVKANDKHWRLALNK